VSVEKLLAEFLQENPDFHVKLKSSAEDVENILKQRDLLKLLEKAEQCGKDIGYSEGYDAGYADGYDCGIDYDT